MQKKIEDFYRYYSKSNDWAVNFSNNKALPPEQIKQYFSKFGTIKNVRQTGDTGTGYCFVHFESEESARNCSIGMKNEFCVRLRPFLDRPRHVPTDNQKENVGLHDEELDFSFKKVGDTSNERIVDLGSDQLKINGDSMKFNGLKSSDVHPGTIGDDQGISNGPKINGNVDSSASGAIKKENPVGTLRKPKLSSLHGSNINGKMNSLMISSKEMNSGSSGGTGDLQKIQNGQLTTEKTDKLSSGAENPESSDPKDSGVVPIAIKELPDLIQKGIPDLIQKGIPDLIEASRVREHPKFHKHPDAVDYELVDAEDVVVANIPEVCDVNFLLNLFQRYEPICGTDIEVIHEYSIRYCHVYFHNRLDAQAVESLYDNVEIYGKRLIVKRANEASSY